MIATSHCSVVALQREEANVIPFLHHSENNYDICLYPSSELGSGIVEAATWMREVCWSFCLCAALSRGLSFLAVAIMRKGRKEEMDKETDESVRPNFAKPELAWQEKAQKEGEDAALGAI